MLTLKSEARTCTLLAGRTLDFTSFGTKLNPTQNTQYRRYRDSWLIRIGAILLLVGSGPLLGIIIAARLGLTRDPNPNPIGFGLLAGLTLWPAVIMIVIGIRSVSNANKRAYAEGRLSRF